MLRVVILCRPIVVLLPLFYQRFAVASDFLRSLVAAAFAGHDTC
jgi:hypothetical protein